MHIYVYIYIWRGSEREAECHKPSQAIQNHRNQYPKFQCKQETIAEVYCNMQCCLLGTPARAMAIQPAQLLPFANLNFDPNEGFICKLQRFASWSLLHSDCPLKS